MKLRNELSHLIGQHSVKQGLVKGAILCFRNLYFYFGHGEITSKSKDLNKVRLILQDLGVE